MGVGWNLESGAFCRDIQAQGTGTPVRGDQQACVTGWGCALSTGVRRGKTGGRGWREVDISPRDRQGRKDKPVFCPPVATSPASDRGSNHASSYGTLCCPPVPAPGKGSLGTLTHGPSKTPEHRPCDIPVLPSQPPPATGMHFCSSRSDRVCSEVTCVQALGNTKPKSRVF